MDILHNIKEIEKNCAEAISARVFPGVGIGVAAGEKGVRKEAVIASGTTRYEGGAAITDQTFFDLASLTKPLATTLLVLSLLRDRVIGLEEPLPRFFTETPADKKNISLRDLLSHCSGLAAHQPYYLELENLSQAERIVALRHRILTAPLQYPTGTWAIYSDLGFLLLGMVVEQVGGQGLDKLFEERITRPLGLSETLLFNRIGATRPGRYAATEFCPWRGRVLEGEVSDENCFVLGGVAGHAGLFGTTRAVLTLVEAIHDLWQGEATPLAIDRADLQHFLTRQPIPGSTWALGFDTPSASGSTSGRFFSPQSVGHLGFTGTSFWLDLAQHVMVVLLTNRVHPSRESHGIKAFRPQLHDEVMRGLGLAVQ